MLVVVLKCSKERKRNLQDVIHTVREFRQPLIQGIALCLSDNSPIVLARAVGRGRKDQGNLCEVEVVEFDGLAAVLVQAAGVVDGHTLSC
jgi:hypothetical protein